MSEESQKVPNSSYKISYGDVIYGMMAAVDNTCAMYLKVVNLKSFHHKKKTCMVTDVNYTYCSDHFAVHNK